MRTKEDELNRLLREAPKSPTYQLERLIDDFTEKLCELLDYQDVSRTNLAQRLGTSKAWITKVLRGDHNMTLKTVVSLLVELGYRPQLDVVPLLTEWESESMDAQSDDTVTLSTVRPPIIPIADYEELPYLQAKGKKLPKSEQKNEPSAIAA